MRWRHAQTRLLYEGRCAGAQESEEQTGSLAETSGTEGVVDGVGQRLSRCWWAVWWWVSALVAVLLLPSVAFAEQWGTVDGPFVTGKTTNDQGYVVLSVSNEYDAALALIGRASDKIQLSNEQFSKLSNASTGGKFYELAQGFNKVGSDGASNSYYPGWWGDSLFQANIVSINGGYGNVWGIETNKGAISSALEDYLVIYNGGSLGGGGTTPGESYQGYATWYGLRFYTSGMTTTKYFYTPQFDANGYVSGQTQTSSTYKVNYQSSFSDSTEFKIYMNGTIKNKIDVQLALGRTVIVAVGMYASGGNQYPRFGVMSIPSDVSYTITPIDNIGNKPCNYYISMPEGTTVYGSIDNNMSSYMYGDYSSPVFYTTSSSNCYFNARTVGSTGRISVTGNPFAMGIFTSDNPNGGGTGGDPVLPPNNWPDNDPVEDPGPPDLPEPGDPVEPIEPDPPDQPVDPYPDPPTVVAPVIPQDPDLTDLLDALANHCRHLRDALHAEFEAFDEDFRDQVKWLSDCFSDVIESLDGSIGLYFDHLERYLYNLFHWLADQFDFTFNSDGYDDSSVILWLRKIYSKLGTGGGGNTRPVDPVSDPFGIGEWLENLFNNFLIDLIAIGAGELADVIADFRDLVTKFPFSIPWDLAAMLALLVADPVTPVIDFPWYAMTSSGLVSTTVRIDCAAWNGTMESVRFMEKLAFCMLLASRSKDLLDFIRLGRGD